MSYRELILDLPKQFSWQPKMSGEHIRPKPRGLFVGHLFSSGFKRIVIAGMGGSRLAPDILKMHWPRKNIHIHSDYGLPDLGEGVLRDALVIANSYSGNTGETVSAAREAVSKDYTLAVVASGGELIKMAEENQLPHIIIPGGDIPSRLAVGYDLVALMALVGAEGGEMAACAGIDAAKLESRGQELAEHLSGGIPLIYAPESKKELGYAWKVILNETAKVPAFFNRFPELNHNEMAGFLDSKQLLTSFRCLILDDGDERLAKGIDKISELYNQKGISVTRVPLVQGAPLLAVVSSVILAHWTALALAEKAGVDPISTPSIEEFKKSL
ncbi:MAG: hypothetical protein A2941_01360 [Candidatus Yanofskybacteria bacterium RIFCSPLOWO2_01_FULL_49_17]|uniref:SIS domain-containing protein n=1 Tax=Candidatus Yanofskybacteria bacterium RIFCSPLOWO2_01_FULL_49_17 TaxID=1802700 RepID=A0A1F8GQC6_9BACT|nr:MAG: hypothetical protein A2941_01360 [Candidatus Yanofskybacteria bacterium RIFCSPLOWO2_01_FULL_49_17]